jgi:hypothetical protein
MLATSPNVISGRENFMVDYFGYRLPAIGSVVLPSYA